MTWKSSPQKYGALPIALHWISALAVLVMLASGLAAASVPDTTAKLGILRVHVSVGICVLLLTLMRIVWWLAIDRRPNKASGVPDWQAIIARIVHYGLYVAIVAMLASGIGLALLSGLIPVLLGAPTPLPNVRTFAPIIVHGLGAWLLIGLTALHIGAALYHQFVRRDRLLARMGVG